MKSGSLGELSETYFRSYYKNGIHYCNLIHIDRLFLKMLMSYLVNTWNELVLLYLTEKRGGGGTKCVTVRNLGRGVVGEGVQNNEKLYA